MSAWIPEIEVPLELARALIESQFPHLAIERLELFGEGWDNVVWRVNETWLFRFPRRQVAVPGVRVEIDALPYLAARLPVRMPDPVFVGRPYPTFPWPWFGYRALEGREACHLELDSARRAALAVPLAGLLRALHAREHVEHLSPLLLSDPWGRANMEKRIPQAVERLRGLQTQGLIDDSRPWEEKLEPALGLMARLETVVHGDLYFRHIMLDEHARLEAVIDWGDLCLGDPAIDLHVYWGFLPPGARPDFLDAYGPVDAGQLAMARVIAINTASVLADYGRQIDSPAILREALAGLRLALED